METYKISATDNVLKFLYCVLFCMVIFTGVSFIFHYTAKYILAISILQIIFACFMRNVATFQRHGGIIISLYMIILGYLVFNYYYSYSRSTSIVYLERFITYGLILIVALAPEWQMRILSISASYAVLIAVVYLICFPIYGSNSGILNDYQTTGISMSIALGLYVSRFFVSKNWKRTDLLKCVLIIMALMLTGKRTLSAIPILMIIVFFTLSCDKEKYRKLLIGLLFVTIITPLLVILFPSLLNVYHRVIEGMSDSTLTYRIYLWQYATMLWKQNPLYGIGIGTVPIHIEDHTLLAAELFHSINAYDTHNIYLQLMAETGVVGLVIFCSFFFINLLYTLHCILTRQNHVNNNYMYLMYVSLYLQCWFLIYGFTGNPLYMADECYLYIFAVSNIIAIKNKIINSKHSDNCGNTNNKLTRK